jgi:transmembrane sensor
MSRTTEVEEEAARWLARRDEADWSIDDEARLDAWLDRDPMHKVVYWELEHTWRSADALKATPSSTRFRPWHAWTGAGLAAAACAAWLIASPDLIQSGASSVRMMSARSFQTELGGRQTVPLADGSRLELDTTTRLKAAVSKARREVWLEEGRAFFDIAHDPAHPFVIHAGQRDITVLGTRFSVRRTGDRVEVAVLDGRVRVEPTDKQPSAPPALATRGDVVVSEGARTTLALNSPNQVSENLAWREGMVTFDHDTLVSAAGEFNRYNRKQIVIEGASAAGMQISGRFKVDEIDAFARIMRDAYGLKVTDDGEQIKISG